MLYLVFLRQQSTIYTVYIIKMTTDITKLEVLIAQEEEHGVELGRKIAYEEKLLKEVESRKLILQRQVLEERLYELQRENILKEEKLIEIRKCKEHTLGEVSELEEEYAVRVSYLALHGNFSYIFWCIL